MPGPATNTKQGGRVITGESADARTLNPILVSDVPSEVVSSRIYAGLTYADAQNGEIKPDLARSFNLSADGKTLSFELRDGLKFSDGSPLTGDDFKFTIMATLRSKKTNHRNYFEQIVGAQDFIDGKANDLTGVKIDGNTITVSLVNSFCPALMQIGTTAIIPQSVFGKYLDTNDSGKNLDDAPENKAPTVASGPFAFKEWVPNDHITLVRNDNYWQKANIDEWVHKVYPTQDALTAALEVGEVDITQFDAKDLQNVQANASIQVTRFVQPGYTYIGWNQMRGGKEFFQEKAVRQALAYGLNLDGVIQKALLGEGVRVLADTVPSSWAYDPAGLNEYRYDPAKAEKLLEDAGYTRDADGIYAKDGKRLEFSLVTNSVNSLRETLVEAAAEQYKQIGVRVEAKTEPFNTLVDRVNNSKDPTYGDQNARDVDAFVLGWTQTADPDKFQTWHSSRTHPSESNFILFKNSDLDKAIEDSRGHCAPAERKAAIKAADQILNEEQPYNFGIAQNYLVGVNKRVHGDQPGTFARWGQARPELWSVQ